MAKRQVEVFIAGCPLCDEAVRTVREVVCESCEVSVYDLRPGFRAEESRAKAAAYGVARVPSVAVDGVLLECCQLGRVSPASLRAAGVGTPS